jgi:hypothetical protein
MPLGTAASRALQHPPPTSAWSSFSGASPVAPSGVTDMSFGASMADRSFRVSPPLRSPCASALGPASGLSDVERSHDADNAASTKRTAPGKCKSSKLRMRQRNGSSTEVFATNREHFHVTPRHAGASRVAHRPQVRRAARGRQGAPRCFGTRVRSAPRPWHPDGLALARRREALPRTAFPTTRAPGRDGAGRAARLSSRNAPREASSRLHQCFRAVGN